LHLGLPEGALRSRGEVDRGEPEPERMPELGGSLGEDEGGPPAVDEDAGGDAQDTFAESTKAPALPGAGLETGETRGRLTCAQGCQ
jgi:hypothetical protein